MALSRFLLMLSVLATSVGSTQAQSFQACAAAPTTVGDRRRNRTQLKFATFNAEFLFLTGFGSLDCPGADCKWTTSTAANNHIRQVASVIHDLDADMIQMNEVEDCTALNAVITQLTALGDSTYRPYLVRGTDTSTGQNSALLTRVDPIVDLQRTAATVSIPVSGSTCPSVSGYGTTRGVSKHFYTTFNVSGFSRPITLVGAHLLANPEDHVRCFQREAQATVLANLANAAVASGYHAIISGDLNDWSRTVPDRNGNTPISNVLNILTGSNFVQVGSRMAQADRYSEWYDEDNDCVYDLSEVSSLDHILVSRSLSTSVSSVTYNHGLYTASCSSYNSDHYPMSIIINAV
jgi:endonuclease/exonuclease/phosphatase family metal-dependent hydrolase